MLFFRRMSMEQYVMGSVFSAMGLGTMLFPRMVYDLCFTKDFVEHAQLTAPMKLMIQCFGAQASLCGLTILSTTWDKIAYRNFAAAIVPFFVFDGYFYRSGALTALGAIGDLAGNLVFVACCWQGYFRCDKDTSRTKD